MTKLSTVVKHLKTLDEGKSDGTFEARDTLFFRGDNCAIVTPATLFPDAKASYDLTPHALGLVCKKLGHIPPVYAKECPPGLRADNLNHWLSVYPHGRKWFLRFNGTMCRAVMSERYIPVNNSEVAEALLKNMGDKYEIVRPYYDADTLHLRFTMMATPGDDNYAYGVYIGNGEIGNRALTVAPFIQRHICANSILLVEGGLWQQHVGFIKSELLAMLKFHVNAALDVATEQRDRIAKAEEENVPNIVDVIDHICKKKGFTSLVRDKVLIGTEGQDTVMALVNGFSWAAHQQDDNEQQVEMEALAGKVLVSGVGGLFGKAIRGLSYAEVVAAQEN